MCHIIRVGGGGWGNQVNNTLPFQDLSFPESFTFYVYTEKLRANRQLIVTHLLSSSSTLSSIHQFTQPLNIECLSSMCCMQNPPISWKPRWIIVALRELWLPSPDYFLPRLACLDQSSFIFSVTRERSSIFSGIRILSFLYQVILIPASLQDTDPDL